MNEESTQTVTITVNTTELWNSVCRGLYCMSEEMMIHRLCDRDFTKCGENAVARIQQIFFPGEDKSLVTELPEKIIARASDVLLDAVLDPEHTIVPSWAELLEVQIILCRARYYRWFEHKEENYFDFI